MKPATITAAQVETFLLAEAAKIAKRHPGENVSVHAGASRWPYDAPSKDRRWCFWSVRIGTDVAPCSRTLKCAEAEARKVYRAAK